MASESSKVEKNQPVSTEIAKEPLVTENQQGLNTLQRALVEPRKASRETIMRLNHLYGNQAVQRLLTSQPSPPVEGTIQRAWPPKIFSRNKIVPVPPALLALAVVPPPPPVPPQEFLDYLASIPTIKAAKDLADTNLNKVAFSTDALGKIGDAAVTVAFEAQIKAYLVAELTGELGKGVRKNMDKEGNADNAAYNAAGQASIAQEKDNVDNGLARAGGVAATTRLDKYQNAKSQKMRTQDPKDTLKAVSSGIKDKVAAEAAQSTLTKNARELFDQSTDAVSAIKQAALSTIRPLITPHIKTMFKPFEDLVTDMEREKQTMEKWPAAMPNYTALVTGRTRFYRDTKDQALLDLAANIAKAQADLKVEADKAANAAVEKQKKKILKSASKYLIKNKVANKKFVGDGTTEAATLATDAAKLKAMGDGTLKGRIEGSDMNAALKKVAALIDMELSQQGDKTKMDIYVEFAIPKFPVGFLGFHFLGEGENEDSDNKARFDARQFNTKVKATISVTGGGQLPGGLASAKARGELGMYFEGQSKSRGEGVMKLFSYAMYQRWRESKYVPNELVDSIWGMGGDGLTQVQKEGYRAKIAAEKHIDAGAVTQSMLDSEAKYQEAELWARTIEESWDDEEKIETGGMAAVGTELKVDTGFKQLSVTGELRVNYGTKYDKKSIAANKKRIDDIRNGKIGTRQAVIDELDRQIQLIVDIVPAPGKALTAGELSQNAQNAAHRVELQEKKAKLQKKVELYNLKKTHGDLRHNVGAFKRFFGRKGRQHTLGVGSGFIQLKGAVGGVGPFGSDAKAKFKLEERTANDKDPSGEYTRNLLKGAEFEVNFNAMVDNQALFGDPMQVAAWSAGLVASMVEKIERYVQDTTGQVSASLSKKAKNKDNLDDFYEFGAPIATLIDAKIFGKGFADIHSIYDPSSAKADVLKGVGHIKEAHEAASGTTAMAGSTALSQIMLGKTGVRFSFNLKKDKGKPGLFWIGVHRDSTKEISMPKGLDTLANLKISHLNSKRLLRFTVLPATIRGFSR